MGTTRSIRQADFKGGHWGLRDQSDAAPNMWFGSNVQVYQDGSIGPRCGIKQLQWTGDPATVAGDMVYPVAFGSTKIWLIKHPATGNFNDVSAGELTTGYPDWLNTGTAVGVAPATPFYIGLRDGIAGGGYQTVFDGTDGRTYFAGGSSGVAVSQGAFVAQAVVDAPAPRMIVRWRDRLVGCQGGDGRIRFSNAGLFANWPAANIMTVGGDNAPIAWLFPAGDTLYVGTVTAIYAVTGVLGASAVVRHVSTVGSGVVSNTPGAGYAALMPDGRLASVVTGTTGRTSVDVTFDSAAHTKYGFFNGQSWDVESMQEDVLYTYGGGSAFFGVAPAGEGALYYSPLRQPVTGGVSYATTLRRTLAGYCEPLKFGLIQPDNSNGRLYFGPGGVTSQSDRQRGLPYGLFVSWAASGNQPVVGYWDPQPGRRGPLPTRDLGIGSAIPASVRFPTIYSQNENLIRLRRVIINGRSYAGGSDAPSITLRAGATGFAGGAADASQANRYSTSTTLTPPATTDDWVLSARFGDQAYGEGAFLDITQIQACSIRSITFVVEEGAELSG